MRVSVYTSCAINYLPKARALSRSLKSHHPDATITLLLNDAIPHWLDLTLEPFDRIWRPEDLGYDRAWVFQHNVMEICTAVKGRGLMRLLESDEADLFLYLDPDVYVYAPLDPLLAYMGDGEIGLVPHITKPEATETGVRLSEMSVALHGTYNLGHLMIRDGVNSRAFAEWWASRLDLYCYDDRDYGLFTDQRWCDMAPALFDKVVILRQPNIDVASWNIFGRRLEWRIDGDDSLFFVDGYPLLTYHFSGTGPSGTHRWVREIFAPCSAAAAELERLYEQAIEQEQQSLFETWRYAGEYFDNGFPVSAGARKLYRREERLREIYTDPYSVAGESYLGWLQKEHPELVNGISLSTEQIERAFEELFDAEFYLRTYPDVSIDIDRGRYADPLDHYVKIGSRLLYDPNPYFVSSYYFDQALGFGVKQASRRVTGQQRDTLLWHYLMEGLKNGLEPIPVFDSSWYIKSHPDLVTALKTGLISSPLSHFVAFGDQEGRPPSVRFNPGAYLANNPAAAAYVASGQARGPVGAFIALGGVPGRISALLTAS